MSTPQQAVQTLGLSRPQQAAAAPEWGEDFDWLVNGEDEPASALQDTVLDFVDEERGDRLPAPTSGCRVWFQRCSDVNSWLVVYACDSGLCAMAYDQG